MKLGQLTSVVKRTIRYRPQTAIGVQSGLDDKIISESASAPSLARETRRRELIRP